MSGGFFRGTSADQDTRFSNKQAKLLKSQKFAPELEHMVDMTKVKMDVMRPWIAHRVTELIGFEDEVLINFIYGLLEGKEVNGKKVQISLTGFMERNTGKFMKELWVLLLSAQSNASGVPQQFLDAKEEETKKKKAESDRLANEIQRRKEKESQELEHERSAKMDRGYNVKDVDSGAEPSSKHDSRRSTARLVEGKEFKNGSRGQSRVSKSPHSANRSSSPRGSRSNSKSISNSDERRRSRSPSASNKRRGRSSSSEKVHRYSPRRSITPRRRHAPRRSHSPSRRSSYSRRRSSSRSDRRSPSPGRYSMRRRSRSPLRRRSRSPYWRRPRSPPRRSSPRNRSRPPIQRRSPSPIRRKSPSPVRHSSLSPIRRKYRGSLSPRRRFQSPIPRRSRSPPIPHRSQSPAIHDRSRSPIRHKSRSPVPRRSRSPIQRKLWTPIRQGLRSPIPRRSLSPIRDMSASPVRGKSKSPIGRRSSRRSPRLPNPKSPLSRELSSASPVELRSVSPIRRKSPKRQGRSPSQSPGGRIRKSTEMKYSSSAAPSSPVKHKRSQTNGNEEVSPGRGKKSEKLDHRKKPDQQQDSRKVRDTLLSEKKRESPIKVRNREENNLSHSGDTRINDRHFERLPELSGKVKQDDWIPSIGSDSDQEEIEKNRAKVKDKGKSKRSERRESGSDDESTSDSYADERKEAKRRRKEEKKMRKEEKRKRREERRRRKVEKRLERQKIKSGRTVSTLSDTDGKHDDDYDNNEGPKRRESGRNDMEEPLTEQKKLEIELREKAIELYMAKKGISH